MSGFSFEQFNGTSTIKDGINLDELEFLPLKDYIGGEILVDGFFFTEGNYGKQVVVVGNGAKINMPKYAVKRFEEIRDNEEAIRALLDGKCKIVDIEELKTKNGKTTGFRLADA